MKRVIQILKKGDKKKKNSQFNRKSKNFNKINKSSLQKGCFNTLLLNEIQRLFRETAVLRGLKKSSFGYVLILCLAILPTLLLGTKYVLDKQILLNRKATGTEYLKDSALDSQKLIKQCAQEAALEVAKKWNPALTYKQQRESMLRIADDVYNKAPTYVNSTVIRAIHGVDIPKESIIKGKIYDPIKVTKTSETRLSPSLKQIEQIQKTTEIHRYYYWCTSGNIWQVPTAMRHFYIVYNSLLRNQSMFTTEDDLYQDYSYYNVCDLAGIRWYHYVTCSEAVGMASYDKSYKIGVKTYTTRADLNDNTVKIECENDKIKVTTNDDIGYAVPAECNVDIILTVPTNSAALNINNCDRNTVPVGASYISTSKTPSDEAQSTPIRQIAKEYQTFLKNFFYTRGVNVGVIPYSDSVFFHNDQSEELKAAGKFIPTYFFGDGYQSMIKGAMILGETQTKGENLASIDVYSKVEELSSKIDLSSYKLKKRKLDSEHIILLSKQSEKMDSNYWLNPYFILKINSDVKFMYGMLGAFYPYYDDRAVSNLIHVPIKWADKLLKSWNATGENSAIDTISDRINLGRLSTPSKATPDRKKALILMVNKPDWFEQENLPYIVIDGDLSEISIVESDYKSNTGFHFYASEAIKKMTQDACLKLKSDWGSNLRIYLIKFRKQIKYKNPVTQAAENFDYSYLNNCATSTNEPYMYDIATQSQLNGALFSIYTNIKDWSGRIEARNVMK